MPSLSIIASVIYLSSPYPALSPRANGDSYSMKKS